MAIVTKYYGIFHKTHTSAYHQEILGFYKFDFDTTRNAFVHPGEWAALTTRVSEMNGGNALPLGRFTIKETDSNGKPLDRPAYRPHDDYTFVIDSESIIQGRENMAWPKPDDQMGANCVLAYGGYWFVDDDRPSPRFLFKKDAMDFARRFHRNATDVKFIKTTRPDVCPTIGLCPKWCYDRDFFNQFANDRWPRLTEMRHIGVGGQWHEHIRGVHAPETIPPTLMPQSPPKAEENTDEG
jgi:hypothetical protein